jgi:hypothetical protein
VSLPHILEGKELNPRTDRHRSPLQADGGARHRICPWSPEGSHSNHVRAFYRTAGRTRNSSGSASMEWGSPQGSREVAPCGGRTRHRTAGSAGQAHREDLCQGKVLDPDLGDGPDQYSFGTANVRASCILLLATGNVGRMGTRHHLPDHDNVQSATDLGLSSDYVAALGRARRGRLPGVGGRVRVDAVPLREQDLHGDSPRHQHALVRCGLAAKGLGQPARHHEGHVYHGAPRQHHCVHAAMGLVP